MKTNFVCMGSFYNVQPYGLVKTVCRVFDSESGESLIAYSCVDKGGYAGDIFVMPESQFINIFCKQ